MVKRRDRDDLMEHVAPVAAVDLQRQASSYADPPPSNEPDGFSWCFEHNDGGGEYWNEESSNGGDRSDYDEYRDNDGGGHS